MKKLLAFCLPVLLLLSCGQARQGQLVLIFENAPENSRTIYDSDTFTFAEKERLVKRLYYFANKGWMDEYVPQGENDTLVISCDKGSNLEFYHNYSLYTGHYANLKEGDTVYVHYEPDGTPIYRSSISDSLTALYNADMLIFGKPPADFKDGLRYKLDRSFVEDLMVKLGREPNKKYHATDSLLAEHRMELLRAEIVIDSLVDIGIMGSAYEDYYRYRIKRWAVEPEILFVSSPIKIAPPLLSEDIYNFFNDDFCCYISYWDVISWLSKPLVKEGGGWDIPIRSFVNEAGEEVSKYDEAAIFDQLGLYAGSIPPKTLSMMRYESLLFIQNPEYQYPQEVQQEYFEKYRRHTTDFLIPDYVPAGETMSFPFRFFIFLLEFIVCSGAFFYLYQALLKDKVGFLASRIYLLAALALSAVLPLLALPVHIAMLPDSAVFWDSMLGSALQVAFYAYLLGCLYMLGAFSWQLYSIRKMQKESWCIPDGAYNLCILTDTEVRPFAFFRNIFFSWSDWWDAESKESRNQLLEHEAAHVKLWHSLDNVLIMLGRILYWANPLLVVYGKEVKRINEFAADHAVAKVYGTEAYIKALKSTDTDKTELQSILVNSNEDRFAERFEKMKAKSAPYRNFRLLLIIPLAVVLMLLFSGESLVNLGKLPDTHISLPLK